MPLLLHIDTSTEVATIAVSENQRLIDFCTNTKQTDHASFLQQCIKSLLQKNNIAIKSLNAVSVTEGPGSYTGLRVGMSSAKGLCYALNIPLITISTLESMALSVIEKTVEPEKYLYCPMIDARRMEVFTALYNSGLKIVLPANAVVLEQEYLEDILLNHKIIFSGNGAQKFIRMKTSPNISSSKILILPVALIKISMIKFIKGEFADINNADSVYIKAFFSSSSAKVKKN